MTLRIIGNMFELDCDECANTLEGYGTARTYASEAVKEGWTFIYIDGNSCHFCSNACREKYTQGFLVKRGDGQKTAELEKRDMVNHPPHYTEHPSGIECIDITRHMNFCLGNAVKYIWRSEKKENQLEDLQKAVWYLKEEIKRLLVLDEYVNDRAQFEKAKEND